MRLIDADALFESYAVDAMECPGCPEPEWLEELSLILDTAPTVDAIKVVRCENCKYKYIKNGAWTCPFGLMIMPDGFCNYGEKGEI